MIKVGSDLPQLPHASHHSLLTPPDLVAQEGAGGEREEEAQDDGGAAACRRGGSASMGRGEEKRGKLALTCSLSCRPHRARAPRHDEDGLSRPRRRAQLYAGADA
jgi:hypothetical protein